MVVCNWVVILSVCITVLCVFDPTGRTFVKLRATKRRQRNLRTYNLRHRLEEGQASSWTRRLKVFLCCTRTKDSQSDAYSEIAYLFAEFFRDLDIVPSDIIAGLVLLRQRQRAKRSAVLDEVGKPGNLGFPAALGFPGSSAWLCPTSFLGCSCSLSWERTIMATSGAFPKFFPVVFPSQRAQLVLSQVWNLE